MAVASKLVASPLGDILKAGTRVNVARARLSPLLEARRADVLEEGAVNAYSEQRDFPNATARVPQKAAGLDARGAGRRRARRLVDDVGG